MSNRKNDPKWYNIHLKSGKVYDVNEEKYKKLREVLMGDKIIRPEFIALDDDVIVRIDSIASIQLEKDI